MTPTRHEGTRHGRPILPEWDLFYWCNRKLGQIQTDYDVYNLHNHHYLEYRDIKYFSNKINISREEIAMMMFSVQSLISKDAKKAPLL